MSKEDREAELTERDGTLPPGVAERASAPETFPAPGAEPPAPGDEVAAALMAQVEAVAVSDLLDLVSRRYRRQIQDEMVEGRATPASAGAEYLAERCAALSGIFRDRSDPARCALEPYACGVDLVRGLRVLAARHPVPEGRELAAALANCCCLVLSERVGGVAVDVFPALDTPDGARRSLYIWHQMVVRASAAARDIAKHGRVSSPGGIAVIGKAAEVRAHLVAEFYNQGMGELGILVGHVGLSLEDPTPAYLRPAGAAVAAS